MEFAVVGLFLGETIDNGLTAFTTDCNLTKKEKRRSPRKKETAIGSLLY